MPRSPNLAAASLALVALALPSLALATDPVAGERPECVHVRTEVRYGNQGYDHLVFVRNGCDRAASCRVTTNANPSPVTLGVGPGQESSVVTFRGSAAREFTARADCALAAR